MITPLVSIVMAAYNEEKYISEAIKSILNQTYTNFEFIIINDGSTDQTESIILSYQDKRIKYLKNEKNLKLIESLNKGLSVANGKYIARMDADDISSSIRLERQIAFMELNPDIGISGSQLNVFGDATGQMKFPLTHEDICLRLFMTSCFGNNVVIFRKKIFEKHKLYFPKGYLHTEDFKCWTTWVKYAKAANLDESLVNYRAHQNSVSVQNRQIQRETSKRIRLEYTVETFNLEDKKNIAEDFTGKISLKRIKAIQDILLLNQQSHQFPNDKIENTIYDLWYMDCLHEIEKDFFILFRFPYIFKLAFRKNFKRWVYLFKHWIKVKLNK